MQTASQEIEKDLYSLSHAHRDDRDRSLRKAYNLVRRKLIIPSLLGFVSIDKTCKSKGVNSRTSWVTRVTVSNLSQNKSNKLQTVLSKSEINVAVSVWKIEKGNYVVEIT